MSNEKFVIASSRLAQDLIAELHCRDPDNESFDQTGLLDGHHIVADYVEHGELGCELHHPRPAIHRALLRGGRFVTSAPPF